MHLNPNELASDLAKLESIEKAALRLLVQALFDYRSQASEIFRNETDNAADIGEDVTQEAISKLGMSKINRRLYGKVDFKRACYLFLPEFSIRLALFIDSKAEKPSGEGVARIQMSQLSMTVKQIRAGAEVTESGKLPNVLSLDGCDYLTITMFVKYVYAKEPRGNELKKIIVVSLPNGFLQDKYNPTHADTIFTSGPNAPTRGEDFRTRLSFNRLKSKEKWRVQTILPEPSSFTWSG
jgi:hypothetical protein